MGFSPGDFDTNLGESLHWEGKADYIALWDMYESRTILILDKYQARKCLDQLAVLVPMLEDSAL